LGLRIYGVVHGERGKEGSIRWRPKEGGGKKEFASLFRGKKEKRVNSQKEGEEVGWCRVRHRREDCYIPYDPKGEDFLWKKRGKNTTT